MDLELQTTLTPDEVVSALRKSCPAENWFFLPQEKGVEGSAEDENSAKCSAEEENSAESPAEEAAEQALQLLLLLSSAFATQTSECFRLTPTTQQ